MAHSYYNQKCYFPWFQLKLFFCLIFVKWGQISSIFNCYCQKWFLHKALPTTLSHYLVKMVAFGIKLNEKSQLKQKLSYISLCVCKLCAGTFFLVQLLSKTSALMSSYIPYLHFSTIQLQQCSSVHVLCSKQINVSLQADSLQPLSHVTRRPIRDAHTVMWRRWLNVCCALIGRCVRWRQTPHWTIRCTPIQIYW